MKNKLLSGIAIGVILSVYSWLGNTEVGQASVFPDLYPIILALGLMSVAMRLELRRTPKHEGPLTLETGSGYLFVFRTGFWPRPSHHDLSQARDFVFSSSVIWIYRSNRSARLDWILFKLDYPIVIRSGLEWCGGIIG